MKTIKQFFVQVFKKPKKHNLRGKWQAHKMFFPFRIPFWLSIFAFAITGADTLYQCLSPSFEFDFLSAAIAVSSLLYCIFLSIRLIIDYDTDEKLIFKTRNNEKDLIIKSITDDSYSNDKNGYIVTKCSHDHLLVSDKINLMLFQKSDKIELTLDKNKKYYLPEETKKFIPYALKQKLSSNDSVFLNQKKIRLVSDFTLQTEKVFIASTNYFSSYTTNELAFDFLQSKKRINDSLNMSTLFVDANKHLYPLEQILMSNHIGISTLAFTNDNQCLILYQDKNNMINKNLYTASGSGSCDWKDCKRKKKLGDLLCYSMNRELREENNLSSDIKVETKVVGYARIIERGGKPEFFGVSFVGDNAKHIISKANSTKEKKTKLIRQVEAIPVDSLEKLPEEIKTKYSNQITDQLCYLLQLISQPEIKEYIKSKLSFIRN